jgi:hypothetical protein
MSLFVDPSALADLLADPGAADTLSAASGCPLVVVQVSDASAAAPLRGLDIGALPAVVVVVAADASCLPPSAASVADIVLTEDEAAPAPFTVPPGGIQAGLDAITSSLAISPVAATTLALLLRSSAGLGVTAGLIAESAAYSALQAGAEFRRWRAAHPAREPEPGTQRVTMTRSASQLRIMLARPARRNAVDRLMRDALVEALQAALADPGTEVRLAGAGPDFCAGGDLDEFGTRPDPAAAHVIRLTRSPALLLHQLSARTTAWLHGACLGAGIELPAFARHVVAAPGTRLGLPEVRLGLIPGAGGTVSVARRIGRARTAFLGVTGQPISADRALAWGLVDGIGTLEPGP